MVGLFFAPVGNPSQPCCWLVVSVNGPATASAVVEQCCEIGLIAAEEIRRKTKQLKERRRTLRHFKAFVVKNRESLHNSGKAIDSQVGRKRRQRRQRDRQLFLTVTAQIRLFVEGTRSHRSSKENSSAWRPILASCTELSASFVVDQGSVLLLLPLQSCLGELPTQRDSMWKASTRN